MLSRRAFAASLAALPAAAQVIPDAPSSPERGAFYQEHWYERGVEHGNPQFNSRFRVNSPEVTLHPEFGGRAEVRGNGMMQILAEEDPRGLDGAQLYLEIWGGHPGTLHKRVTINGRTTYWLPEVGTAAGHCTHQYPTIELARTDIVNGYNALQFACDQGPSFWGHFIVENALLRTRLRPGHPILKKASLDGFTASLRLAGGGGGYSFSLGTPLNAPPIAEVEFQAFYEGFDENGNGAIRDWHGFTKARKAVAQLGTASSPPFAVRWDTSMLPQQDGVSVRARVRFRDFPGLVYELVPLKGLPVNPSTDRTKVEMFSAREMPVPFWSRAGNRKTAALRLPFAPSRIEKAELHVVAWDGGAGNVKGYFTLNGRPLTICGAGRHDVMYTVLPIDPTWLREGDNEIALLSDTEHHGIELLAPGPALMLRHG